MGTVTSRRSAGKAARVRGKGGIGGGGKGEGRVERSEVACGEGSLFVCWLLIVPATW